MNRKVHPALVPSYILCFIDIVIVQKISFQLLILEKLHYSIDLNSKIYMGKQLVNIT